MRKFLIVDATNLFFRIKSVLGQRNDADMAGALGIQTCLFSVAKVWEEYKIDHVVFALEGGKSWRRDIYKMYKGARRLKNAEQSDRDREDTEIFFEYMNEFSKFLEEKTNITVLQAARCEADDVIAGFIQLHDEDHHIILSNDSDFFQLLAPNVELYRAQANERCNIDGVWDEKGQPVLDKKTKKPIQSIDPKWELFKKILRGDTSDSILTAVKPRTRETKIREAYEDRTIKGISWANIMYEEWEDHEGVVKSTAERVKLNEKLIDLTKQPADIKHTMFNAIIEACDKKQVAAHDIGFAFMRFCKEYDLQTLSKNSTRITKILKAGYAGD